MNEGPHIPDGQLRESAGLDESRAVSPHEAAQLVDEVHRLVKAGDPHSAWERIRNLHPADIGSILGGLPRNSRDAMVRVMSPETITWVLRQMNPVETARLGSRLGSHMLSLVIGQVHPPAAKETLQRIAPSRAQEVVQALEQPLEPPTTLAHPDGTAGSMMVTQFPSVRVDSQAKWARESLRAQEDNKYKFTHVLVLEDDERLVGQVAVVDLALVGDETPVHSIAHAVLITLTVDTPADECARLRRHYDLTQLPVVEGERVIGVVLGESLLKATVEQDTRQMLRVASVSGESADSPMLTSVRARLPWLTVNLATTFVSAAIISLFESTLAQVVALAAFLPVIAGQGGIGGTQTLTLIVRAIALGELLGVGVRRIVFREAAIGLLHGLWLGVLVAGIAIIWQQNLGLALVLGLSMFGNMVLAGPIGALIPLLLRRVGVDPALASAVIVTTFTDVFGFLLFLGIATTMIALIQ